MLGTPRGGGDGYLFSLQDGVDGRALAHIRVAHLGENIRGYLFVVVVLSRLHKGLELLRLIRILLPVKSPI